ncbi:MAG: YdeI/OmpD-associated family protein [Thermoleophilia bacterium]
MAPEPVFLDSPAAFRAWLAEHHATASELLVGFRKVRRGVEPPLRVSDAVEQALCFGWIDGQLVPLDDERYAVRFSPRQARSTWSRVNVRRFEALLAAGLVEPAGLAAWERRDDARTGVYSFEREEPATLTAEQEARFRANEAAWAFFQSQPPGYRRTALHVVTSAKREATRERRLEQLIADSAAGRRLAQLAPRPRRGPG